MKVYPLKDSFILDSGSDTHICNNLSRFLGYQPSREPEVLYAGGFQMEILGYGKVHLQVQDGLFQLNEVAYIPAFHTNIVSLDLLIRKGYNWNPATGTVFKGTETIFSTRRVHRQWIIEFNEKASVPIYVKAKAWSDLRKAAYKISLQPCQAVVILWSSIWTSTNENKAWTGRYPGWLHSDVLKQASFVLHNARLNVGVDDVGVDEIGTKRSRHSRLWGWKLDLINVCRIRNFMLQSLDIDMHH
ncbi:reverse transcriptase family protein [Ilyonectria robusta]